MRMGPESSSGDKLTCAAGAVEREFISLLGGAAATWPINFKPNQFRRQVGKSVDFSLCPSNLEHYVTAVHVERSCSPSLVASLHCGADSVGNGGGVERNLMRVFFEDCGEVN
jgi:hypothetical protein